jgi:hypothetical protein
LKEHITSIIRVTKISELGTMLAVTKNWSKPHGVTSQKRAFFRVTVIKTSNLTYH